MRAHFTFLICFFNVSLVAQIQIGLVREQNSNRKPLSGVQVNFTGAVPTTSDDNGIFRLAFQDKKPGDFIFVEEVSKQGYELVNEKELEMLKIGNSDRLMVDIILAKSGTIDAARKEYYNVSDKALLAGLNHKKQELYAKIKDAEITQNDFIEKIAELQVQYERQKRSLDELAEKFAKVNFDDVSTVYQEALELFKQGKVDEAIKKLEDADILGHSEKLLSDKIRIENAMSELNRQKMETEAGIQEDAKAILKQAQMYIAMGQSYHALPFFEMLLLVDGDNPTILLECADFFEKNELVERALLLFKKVYEHPNADAEQKSKSKEAINNLSLIIIKKY